MQNIIIKANPVPFMLEYDFQPVKSQFACIELIMMIMMMTIGASRS